MAQKGNCYSIQKSKVMKDSERLVNAVVKIVEGAKAPGSHDFRRVAGLLVTVDEQKEKVSLPTPPGTSPEALRGLEFV